MDFPTTLEALLAPAGVALVFGYLSAFLLENVSFFQTLNALQKRAALVVLATLLNLLAFSVLNFVPPATIAALQPWYLIIVTGLTLGMAEYTHQKVNR